MSTPLAYFITIHTYGTWLVGDDRGYVQDHQNVYGEPFLYDKPGSQIEKLNYPPYVLDSQARQIVYATILEVCDHRKWCLLALHVRTNHVHLVIHAEASPSKILADLKAYPTRRLRESGIIRPSQPVWGRHGSTRHLFNEEAIHNAIKYTVENQGVELVPAPFLHPKYS